MLSHLHYGTTEHYFRPKMIRVMSQFTNCFRFEIMFQHCHVIQWAEVARESGRMVRQGEKCSSHGYPEKKKK